MGQQALQFYITVVICLILMVVAVGILVRGIAGPQGHAAYNRFWGRALHQFGRQAVRFVRWTLRNHWQFWLGFVVGAIFIYLIMSP